MPSRQVAAPRIAEAPCAMECRSKQIIDYPRGSHVNPQTYQPIGRLHADNYVTSDRQIVLEDDDPAA